MARGTKKTVEALEQKFETQKKPVQQDFFDLLASFYHKDEDLAFLISLSKATVTDVEAGEDHTRFMTSLRTYQAIQFWTRLGKLTNLYADVNTLIMQRINEMWSQLLANDDTDNVIDTLGEVFAAFQNFQEYTGGLNAHFGHFYSVLKDLTGERVVRDTFDNHDGRIGNLEYKMLGVPNVERQVQNSFDDLFSRLRDLTGDRVVADVLDNHEGRLDSAENLLDGLSGNKVIKNTLDDLLGRLEDLTETRSVANALDSHHTRINTAQSTANTARDEAATALSRANDAHDIIGRPGGTGEKVWARITGVYSYAETVAGVVNQIEFMLGGYTFGQQNAIKIAIDAAYNRTTDLYNITTDITSRIDGFQIPHQTQINQLFAEVNSIKQRLTNASIP